MAVTLVFFFNNHGRFRRSDPRTQRFNEVLGVGRISSLDVRETFPPATWLENPLFLGLNFPLKAPFGSGISQPRLIEGVRFYDPFCGNFAGESVFFEGIWGFPNFETHPNGITPVMGHVNLGWPYRITSYWLNSASTLVKAFQWWWSLWRKRQRPLCDGTTKIEKTRNTKHIYSNIQNGGFTTEEKQTPEI